MKMVSIRFTSISDLLDFESVVIDSHHDKDHSQLSILGYFEEADIELAKAAYKAIIIDETAAD